MKMTGLIFLKRCLRANVRFCDISRISKYGIVCCPPNFDRHALSPDRITRLVRAFGPVGGFVAVKKSASAFAVNLTM